MNSSFSFCVLHLANIQVYTVYDFEEIAII